MWLTLGLIAFGLAWAVQLGFVLVVCRPLTRSAPPLPAVVGHCPVSVIVCVHHEAHRIGTLIEEIYAQQYPKFELVVVDDRSDEPTQRVLAQCQARFADLRVVRIDLTPSGLNPKKFALTQGIAAAQYDRLLLTDADCRPAGPRWIAAMMAYLHPPQQLVLGYAPYLRQPGFLNRFIRYETLYTAIQYLSFGLTGWPYMGVGRNLAYSKALFFSADGFADHAHVTGGDDDLFVNKVAQAHNVAICLHPDSFTYSYPKNTWFTWFRQKIRHLSVGKRYRQADRWRLGMLALSHLMCWVVGLLLLSTPYGKWVLAGWAVRSGLQARIFHQISHRLHEGLSWFWFPLFDLLYLLYYLTIGVSALAAKRVRWK